MLFIRKKFKFGCLRAAINSVTTVAVTLFIICKRMRNLRGGKQTLFAQVGGLYRRLDSNR